MLLLLHVLAVIGALFIAAVLTIATIAFFSDDPGGYPPDDSWQEDLTAGFEEKGE